MVYVLTLKVCRYFLRDKETEVLKQQISLLKDAIHREKEKSADLEMKSKYVGLIIVVGFKNLQSSWNLKEVQKIRDLFLFIFQPF